MNPEQFPNPGAGPGRPAPTAAMRMKANMQIPKGDSPQSMMAYVAQMLQSQGPYGGWKADVPIKARAANVYQMITSLRLIQPRIDLHQAAQAAMTFELKAFTKANEKSEYDNECKEKLLHIRSTRERQAAVAYQSGMIPQTGAGQNQMSGAFPQHPGMQASPIPGQPQMGMGMNGQNQQVAMQQQQRQQQQSQAMLQQQQQQQQRGQQRPGNGIPMVDELSTLSAQDLDHVSRLANEMLNKTSPEDMEKIKMNLSNMTPEQRQYLARKNLEPMTYFFRSQALNQIRRHRRARLEMGGVRQVQHQRQMLQNMLNLQRNSAFPGNPGQTMEPPNFIGNVENIQGQQADGLRSQEAGQLVVPASSTQMNQTPFPNNNNMFPQQMGQNTQANMNSNNPNANAQAQFLAQQHLQGGSNTPQDRMQFQAQQAQAQARAQAAQKAQMAMSGHGGQANPQAQSQMNGQSPAMTMLNQPMAPAQMSPVQVPAQARPPSRSANMGQHPAGVAGQAALQGRPAMPNNIPPHIQEQLSRMTQEQAQAFMMQHRRAALNNLARANPGPQPQPGQTQPMMNNQMGNAMMRGPMGGVPQDLNLPQNQQQLTPQQRQQRQNEAYKLQMLRQQNNGVEMTQEQCKQMDRVSFPPSILNMNGTSMQVPSHVKSWGQLKQWAMANPQIASSNDLPRLLMLQKLHLGQLISNSGGQVRDQNGQGPAATPFQSSQIPFANAPGLPPGQQPAPFNTPAMRPISAQDIHMARQKLGQQASSLTDEQIRELLYRNRQKHMMQAAQNRAMQQEANAQPGQLGHPMAQPLLPAAQPVQQAKPQPSLQQPRSTPQPANTKVQAGTAAKGGRAAAGKQPSKKRASAEDTETPAMATPQMNQSAAVSGAPANTPQRPGLPFTQEQLAHMTPQQRAQVEMSMRRQQPQGRNPVSSRAAAEDAWNRNLPPHLMEIYNDIAKNMPPAMPVPLSPEQKAAMTKQLREAVELLGRMDVLVQWYSKMSGQEPNVKSLLNMRIQLMRQFKPTQDWVVSEHLTLKPEFLQGAILFIRKLFAMMISRMRPNVAQPPGSTAPAAQGNMPALNATNLQQLQAQEEALQKARRASSQSANPPAAPFAAPSPRGVPQYASGGLAPENLKLPPPKKRKQSHAVSSSPVQAAPTPGGAASKYNRAVADATSGAAAMAGAFKCSVVECQNHYQGFPTQAALDKHVEENHQPEEQDIFDNYINYYHESLSIGLGLNPNESSDAQPTSTLPTAPPSAKPGAAPSPVKQGVATPINAVKTASPTPAQLLTPQTSSVKGVKRALDKDERKDSSGKTEETGTKDAWAKCPTSLNSIHDTFAVALACTDLPPLAYDSIDDFTNDSTPVNDWLALASLTPPNEADEATFQEKFYEPWDDESIALAAKRMGIPPEIQAKGKGLMGQLEVDWDAVERLKKEGIKISVT
ncbi:UAA transporter [Penicillium sp. DV-2018c]|nr:UAA transporter [Penicillium sp. DV-2018c]KAJ5582082.1 UAA transporter [Penicillium sp. DV-2018c]